MRVMKEILFVTAILYCTSGSAQMRKLGITIDSIYVNEIEKGDTIRELLKIMYYCTAINRGNSAFELPIQNYLAEARSNVHCYLIHGNDTLDLFLNTLKKVVIKPKGKTNFSLISDTIELVDLLQRLGYSFDHPTKVNGFSGVDILKSIARESYILIEWPAFEKKIDGLKSVKVRYKDPNNDTID